MIHIQSLLVLLSFAFTSPHNTFLAKEREREANKKNRKLKMVGQVKKKKNSFDENLAMKLFFCVGIVRTLNCNRNNSKENFLSWLSVAFCNFFFPTRICSDLKKTSGKKNAFLIIS
jgi:hypothetical protein